MGSVVARWRQRKELQECWRIAITLKKSDKVSDDDIWDNIQLIVRGWKYLLECYQDEKINASLEGDLCLPLGAARVLFYRFICP